MKLLNLASIFSLLLSIAVVTGSAESARAARIASVVDLGASFSPMRIGDDGQVFGYGNFSISVYSDGRFRPVTAEEQRMDLWNGNADGTDGVAWIATGIDGLPHVYRVEAGVERDLGSPDGLDSENASSPKAVNLAGIAVGQGYISDPTGRLFRAMLYEQGQTFSLTDWLPTDSVFDSLNTAYGINNRNQIVGLGVVGNELRGYIATLVPEPGMVTICGLGFFALLGYHRFFGRLAGAR